MKKIYLGLTTWKSDWRAKIKEIDDLGFTEVALFPTSMEPNERKELYSLLEKSRLKKIPFVHLRHDFETEEVEWLIKKYDTKVFNIHADKECLEKLPKFTSIIDKIYVENSNVIDDNFTEILDKCAGICLDISHYEDFGLRQHRSGYDKFEELLKSHKIGCCHIPAVRDELYGCETHGSAFKVYESHHMNDLSEMNYLKKHLHLLSDFNAIELNNSFREQLEVKKYLEKIIESE